MSEADAQPPKATEETPAEAPSATTEETPVDTPAADDQPAVTEVTEVTAAEGEDTPKEEAPKVEEKPKEEEPKKKEKPKVVKVVDYRTSKAGWVQKRSLIFKKWQRQYMSLDEEDSVLRWWKTENHTGLDSALYMKYCTDVSEPKPEATITWPDDTKDRWFVVCSPNRTYYLVAESAEEKSDWIQKLTAAKEKWYIEPPKPEPIVKKEEKVADASEGTPAETAATETAAVTVQVEVEGEGTSKETPKEETPAEEAPKDETPAEEAPKEETPAEEPPKDETPAEEAPKEETPAEEPPKDETPAVEEATKDETPAEEAPKEETPAEEPPKDETPATTGGEETKPED